MPDNNLIISTQNILDMKYEKEKSENIANNFGEEKS